MNEREKSLIDSVVCFGSCQLDARNVQLWRDHQEVKLTGKAFAVLCHFVEHPGQLVMKDDLFAAAWPETVVSDATLASCIQEVRQALGDDAKRPRYIETVHRRGFRFIENVVSREEENQKAKGKNQKAKVEEERATETIPPSDSGLVGILEETRQNLEDKPEYEATNGQGRVANGQGAAGAVPLLAETSLPLSNTTTTPRRFRWWQVLVLIIGLVLGGGLAANWRLVRLVVASYASSPVVDPVPLPLLDKPSLVVLPLVNLSGDASQEYFSDGLTDDLINTLAQFPDLFVIARHSAFTYKGRTIKEQDVGRELGVRYVLEGSVRRAGEQVRMNVQLVDATTGEQLWAERYDRPFTEIFALQDDLVQKLATTLTMQLPLLKQGFSIAKTTDNVEAYDYVLRGMAYWFRATKKDNLRAREFFEKALTLDPQSLAAYLYIGLTYYMEWIMKWSPGPQALEQMLEYGQKAVALDDFHPGGHMILALAYAQKAQIDRALSETERVIALLPNYADSYAMQAEVLLVAGRPLESLQSIQRTLRLNPHGQVMDFATLGFACNFTDQYAESIAAYKRALALTPLYPLAYPMQAFNFTSQWITQQSYDSKLLDQAYDAAQYGVTLNDAYPLAHAALGTVYLLQKQYDDAITQFERAVALDENFVCSQMLFAFGLSQVGRVEEAVQVGERALSLKALPPDDRCLFGVAAAYTLVGRLEAAAALHLRLLKQFPNSLGSHLELTAIYSKLIHAINNLRTRPKWRLMVKNSFSESAESLHGLPFRYHWRWHCWNVSRLLAVAT